MERQTERLIIMVKGGSKKGSKHAQQQEEVQWGFWDYLFACHCGGNRQHVKESSGKYMRGESSPRSPRREKSEEFVNVTTSLKKGQQKKLAEAMGIPLNSNSSIASTASTSSNSKNHKMSEHLDKDRKMKSSYNKLPQQFNNTKLKSNPTVA